MIVRLIAAALSVIVAAVPASAEPRQPSGKWVADFGDAQCIASRDYGTKADPFYLVLKAPAIGSVMQLTVLRKGGPLRPVQAEATVAIGGTSTRTSLLAFRPSKSELRSYVTNVPLSSFAMPGQVKTISIRAGSFITETFAVSSFDGLLRVLDDCVAGLRKAWNISDPPVIPEKFDEPPPNRLLQQRARGDLRGLFSHEDYPAIALNRLQSGSTMFLMLIDEQGRVSDCTVIESSGVAALDAQSCAVIKERARFKPSIGHDGRPAKDALVQKVTWRVM